jgi:hypothetical protein
MGNTQRFKLGKETLVDKVQSTFIAVLSADVAFDTSPKAPFQSALAHQEEQQDAFAPGNIRGLGEL